MGVTDFKFFEAREEIADTQTYGFVLDETGYINVRRTEFFTFQDWATDVDSTTTMHLSDERKVRNGPNIGELYLPRHTGFAICWGSVRPAIQRWLNRLVHEHLIKRTV